MFKKSTMQSRLVDFLEDELAIPPDWISLAQAKGEQDPSLLPMVLWQYGLVTLEQLDRVFDWMEAEPLATLN
ncbi:DUF2949 domain-containing protein [Aerosakkonema sp. BLCC-F183]|uniref:DUF2949 domain-containing protein n=1 Tax=Aerosakkonema sp. BLCC-F183 TaxID=3342834 RepID=UPI0035BC01F2